MGKFDRARAATGLQIPVSGRRTDAADLNSLVEACASEDAGVRQLALRHLCTCHVRASNDEAWRTILLLFDDPDFAVRAEALHALTDSTPAVRVPGVVDALEARYHEPNDKLRRRIRKTLSYYRRTGSLTDKPR